jgi:hypothetical protein
MPYTIFLEMLLIFKTTSVATREMIPPKALQKASSRVANYLMK